MHLEARILPTTGFPKKMALHSLVLYMMRKQMDRPNG
jgi:hypothetical protein